MTKNYDVVIIGAGPAGMSAGLYAARDGLKTVIISKDIGGTTNSILLLENWPGFSGTGAELMKKFYEQLKEYKIDFIMQDVEKIKKEKEGFCIETKKQKIYSKSVIIASGTKRRKLNVPGEKELTGKGVSYCVTCDAFFFKNKTVGVVGGSDCAAISALALSDLAKKVYVFYRGKKLRCEEITSKRLEKKENVEIVYEAVPLRIKGESKVEGLVVRQNEKEKEFNIDGVFIEIGAIALIEFIKDLDLELDKDGQIIVDSEMKTSVDGVFAAGDVTHSSLKQVVVAASQGAVAAKSASAWVKKS